MIYSFSPHFPGGSVTVKSSVAPGSGKMVFSYKLQVRHNLFDCLGIGRIHQAGFPQPAFLLGRLLGENVA